MRVSVGTDGDGAFPDAGIHHDAGAAKARPRVDPPDTTAAERSREGSVSSAAVPLFGTQFPRPPADHSRVPVKACHVTAAMRPLLTSLLASAILSTCAVMSTPGSVEAATGVARCAMPDGTFAYTSAACSELGGSHATLPAEVQNRIQRERLREARLTGAALPSDGGLLAALPSSDTGRPKGQGCATTPRQLAVDLRASMAQGDVNRIAESFDWAGMSHSQAMRMMNQLERLEGFALVDAEYFGTTLDSGPQFAGGTLQVILQDAGAHKVTDFDVRRNGGCYFLQHTWAV